MRLRRNDRGRAGEGADGVNDHATVTLARLPGTMPDFCDGDKKGGRVSNSSTC